jgi:NitT/TauT family transport system substrate-binding protein
MRNSHRIRRTQLVLLLLCLTVLAAMTTGCTTQPSNTAGTPEKARVRLGVLPIADDAHLQRAQLAGYFAAEGLEVELVPVQGGANALPLLSTGDLDMTFTNYVSVLLAQSQHAGEFRFIDGGYDAGPNTILVMTRPGSPIRSARDLERKRIAVNTLHNVIELNTRSALETNGVDPASVTFVPVPFPAMAAALADGQVDAATMVEPFITQSAQAFGAVSVLDAAAGPTASIPLGGVAVPADFAVRNPNTVAAFQRAVEHARADLADRGVLESTLPTYTGISPDTAALIALGTWPPSLDRIRLQRVADLMRQYGVLADGVDTGTMILARPEREAR